MESFYLKSNEVELVLVDDQNDFIDPLETNLDYEEDANLQLNDDICDDSKFNFEDEFEPLKVTTNSNRIKQEKPATNKPNESVVNLKSESESESDNESFGVDVGEEDFSDGDSDDAFLMPTIKLKNDSKEKNSTHIRTQNNQKIGKLNCDDVKKAPKIVNERIQLKTDSVKKEKSKIKNIEKHKSSNKNTHKSKEPDELVELRPKPDPKRKRPDARPYSTRNEIPKKTLHNEAYDKKLLYCKICDIQFEKSPFFTEHMRNEHSIDKPFECYICQKAYRISSLLAEHIRYHFGEKPYQCEQCHRSFSQLQPYKAHVRKMHTLEKPYKCDFINENGKKCDETFFDTKTLKAHLREHTNTQPYQCQVCLKKFHHSGTFRAHMRIHTNEKPFQCCECGKSFAQISTHKAHMLTHSTEYNYTCTVSGCEKKFKQPTSLKLHLRTHTKETPYTCEDCGRGFAQLISYRNHRRIHTGEKPFQCTYGECGRLFRHRNSLKRHLQTHTGEKPFECNICYKRLSQISSLAAHMRKHEHPKKC